jgi:hypothetical protein
MPWNTIIPNLLLFESTPGQFSGVFGYSPVPGPGNLIYSLTVSSGTDPFGNPYLGGGLVIYGSGGSKIFLGELSGVAELQMYTGEAIEGFPANLFTAHIGSGVGEYLQTGYSGPKLNVVGSRDWWQLQLNSSQNGSGPNAVINFIYIDDSGATHDTMFMGPANGPNSALGVTIPSVSISAGTLTAPQPSTGSSTAFPTPEVWHAVAGGVGYSNSWADTGAGVPTGKYRVIGSPVNSVEVIADISHAAIAGTSATFTLPVGYRPANQQIWPLGFLVCTAGFANAANPPLVTVTTGGVVNLQSLPAGTTRVQFHFIISLDA